MRPALMLIAAAVLVAVPASAVPTNPAPPGESTQCKDRWTSDEPGLLWVRALDASGSVMMLTGADYWPREWHDNNVAAQPSFNGWSMFLSGESLSDQLLSAGDALLLRIAGTRTACPTPLEPIGQLYRADLPDGSVVVAQLRGAAKAAEVQARHEGHVFDFKPITPLELAQFQFAGEQPELHQKDWSLAQRIAWVDNRALLMHDAGDAAAQAAVLADDMEVLRLAEAAFLERQGSPPATMCELHTGASAVALRLPLNPYDPARMICGCPAPSDAPVK